MPLNTALPANMHTHRPEGTGSNFLLSCRNCNAAEYTSFQFHPWHLPESFVTPEKELFTDLKKYSALGEIGLDRLRGPDLRIQRQYFDFLLEMASDAGLPVVIHCVRCEAELFSSLKGFPNNVLIHGFRGGVKTLTKYLDAGYFVSFNNVANQFVADFLKNSSLENTGIESDDSIECIESVAERISRTLDMDVRENSIKTFRKFLNL